MTTSSTGFYAGLTNLKLPDETEYKLGEARAAANRYIQLAQQPL